jgi:hypothetical protein
MKCYVCKKRIWIWQDRQDDLPIHKDCFEKMIEREEYVEIRIVRES